MSISGSRTIVEWIILGLLTFLSILFGANLIGVYLVQSFTIFHMLNAVLLALMPGAGVIGLWRRKQWGRNLAIMSLLCYWGYALRGFWLTFGDRSPIQLFRMSPILTGLLVLLAVTFVLLPYLAITFWRQDDELKSENKFLTEALEPAFTPADVSRERTFS